jgi:uncharacterized membrane protein YjgN (DUF898 family)
MEIIQTETTPMRNKINFNGDGWELLGIMILNGILNMVTLFIYYPWSRVNKLRFIYQNAALNDTPFVFHGTGKELFRGFVKVLLLFALFVALIVYKIYNPQMILPLFAFYLLVLFVIVPVAIHGALRYRLSRTSWRGIHFGYRGDRQQLIMKFITGYLGVMFSFGIYTSWFVTDMRNYIIGNIRFGNLRFGYDGKGGELFLINLKGLILGICTLGIYYFWYKKRWMNYFAQHTYIEQDGNRYYLESNYGGEEFLWLVLGNLFLTIFTLGLGTPWIILRTARFVVNNIDIPAEIDFNRIAQTEDNYEDATGEDIIDFLDLGII